MPSSHSLFWLQELKQDLDDDVFTYHFKRSHSLSFSFSYLQYFLTAFLTACLSDSLSHYLFVSLSVFLTVCLTVCLSDCLSAATKQKIINCLITKIMVRPVYKQLLLSSMTDNKKWDLEQNGEVICGWTKSQSERQSGTVTYLGLL